MRERTGYSTCAWVTTAADGRAACVCGCLYASRAPAVIPTLTCIQAISLASRPCEQLMLRININQPWLPTSPDVQSVFQYGKLPCSGLYPRYNICTPEPVFWRYCHCQTMAGYIDEVPQASVTRSSNVRGKQVQPCQCYCFSIGSPLVRATLSRKVTHCKLDIETARRRSAL
jgi:hypothetical protein